MNRSWVPVRYKVGQRQDERFMSTDTNILALFVQWHFLHLWRSEHTNLVACYWLCPRIRVHEAIERPSVRCPIDRSRQRRAASLLLSAWWAGYIDRLRHGAYSWRAVQQAPVLSSKGAAARRSAANAGSVTLTADVGSWPQTCYVRIIIDELLTTPAWVKTTTVIIDCCISIHLTCILRAFDVHLLDKRQLTYLFACSRTCLSIRNTKRWQASCAYLRYWMRH